MGGAQTNEPEKEAAGGAHVHRRPGFEHEHASMRRPGQGPVTQDSRCHICKIKINHVGNGCVAEALGGEAPRRCRPSEHVVSFLHSSRSFRWAPRGSPSSPSNHDMLTLPGDKWDFVLENLFCGCKQDSAVS